MYKVVKVLTRLYKDVQGCTLVVQVCTLVVQVCTRSYKVVHCCTMLYKVVQGHTRLYKDVQPFTRLYRLWDQLYQVVRGYISSYRCVHWCICLYNHVHCFPWLYKVIWGCTWLHTLVHARLYKVLQGCTMFGKDVHEFTTLYNLDQPCMSLDFLPWVPRPHVHPSTWHERWSNTRQSHPLGTLVRATVAPRPRYTIIYQSYLTNIDTKRSQQMLSLLRSQPQ